MTHSKNRIQIKKYGNRRLYDMAQKRYITLDELTSLIEEGNEVQVLDSKTGEDITQTVLIQLILDTQKNGHPALFPTELLHQMIQHRERSMAEFFHQYLPNILQSYMDWQEEAQSQFLHWARLGWSASQYSRDWLMPGFSIWGMGRRYRGGPTPVADEEMESANDGAETVSTDAAVEIEALKRKIAQLENRLKKPRKQG